MTIKEAKAIDMVCYLSIAGIEPAKIKGENYWFYSPFRNEKTPSFKVNRKLNKWYDFGEGRGGDLLDFIMLYENFSIPQALKRLEQASDVPNYVAETVSPKTPAIEIQSVHVVSSAALIRYYQYRRISNEIADKWLYEIRYRNGDKNYYALGFENDAGGYELRNAYYKGSSHPKASTLVKNGSTFLSVFEGAYDFLSYLTITANQEHISSDFLILNSTSFFEQQLPLMQAYDQVSLFLDNDPTGDKFTAKAVKLNSQKFEDERSLYKGYKDVNDWHQHLGLQPVANLPLR